MFIVQDIQFILACRFIQKKKDIKNGFELQIICMLVMNVRLVLLLSKNPNFEKIKLVTMISLHRRGARVRLKINRTPVRLKLDDSVFLPFHANISYSMKSQCSNSWQMVIKAVCIHHFNNDVLGKSNRINFLYFTVI